MKKIRITITMTEEEAAWLEQICFIEEELPWQKFINRVGKTVRRARHAFQQSVRWTGLESSLNVSMATMARAQIVQLSRYHPAANG